MLATFNQIDRGVVFGGSLVVVLVAFDVGRLAARLLGRGRHFFRSARRTVPVALGNLLHNNTVIFGQSMTGMSNKIIMPQSTGLVEVLTLTCGFQESVIVVAAPSVTDLDGRLEAVAIVAVLSVTDLDGWLEAVHVIAVVAAVTQQHLLVVTLASTHRTAREQRRLVPDDGVVEHGEVQEDLAQIRARHERVKPALERRARRVVLVSRRNNSRVLRAWQTSSYLMSTDA